jgi:hypothetical protein
VVVPGWALLSTVTIMENQELTNRNSSNRSTRAPQLRPATKGVRRRIGGNHGNGKPFAKGQNSHNGAVHRRGRDRIPRGTMRLLYQTIWDDDGTLLASLEEGDNRFRAFLIRGFFWAVTHRNPLLAILAAETIADRLEGRPVRMQPTVEYPQAIFYRSDVGVLGGPSIIDTHHE